MSRLIDLIQIGINVDTANSDIVFVLEVHGMNSGCISGGTLIFTWMESIWMDDTRSFLDNQGELGY